MHIPDGYLSPQTGGVLYAVMLPLWIAASKIVKKTFKTRQVPYLAFGASFSFVIMMFNVPIPGGSTGHAVGGTLIAILLGPWAAMVAVTVALAIQALLFGDGGITAFGANCFAMAFVLPFVGYYIYRLISLKSPKESLRRPVAAAIGAYFGLVAASLAVGFLFGIQPILYHAADGKALYCPYGLNIALPVMLFEHLFIFGFIEAAVTFLVIKYLQKEDPSLMQQELGA
jgi:cobalt/nickel transport system permease protein